jgi:hypothetical protein
MELDFSRLNGLSSEQSGEIASQPSKTPTKTFLEIDEYDTTNEKSALDGLTEGLDGVPILQRQADANKAEKERALEVCRRYQENMKRSGQLQTDILKGIRRGENIYSLFLKAAQAISLMTSDTVFCNQINNDIKAIYGAGLSEPKLLELELEEVQGRLEKLRKASEQETEDSQRRIRQAIQVHEQRIDELKEKITKAQDGESLTA